MTKSIVFERFGVLNMDVFVKGLIAGSSLMAGSFIAKRFVMRLDANTFRYVMDVVIILAQLKNVERQQMKFILPTVDLRSDGGGRSIDDENGNLVGSMILTKEVGRTITLLGKYSGTFKTQQECEAFAKGVAAVVNHVADRSTIRK